MAVTASLVINFGDLDDAFLAAEINSDDNEGKTTYLAGDTVKFRIYHSCGYTVTQTAGSTVQLSTDVAESITKEIITFAFTETGSTEKFIVGSLTGVWMGTPLGTIKQAGHNSVSSGGGANSIGVAEINYASKYDLWEYSSPASINGSVTFTIIIGVTATGV